VLVEGDSINQIVEWLGAWRRGERTVGPVPFDWAWRGAAVGLVLVLVAGRLVLDTGSASVSAAPRPVATRVDPRDVAANEAGKIVVLAYHRVGDPSVAPDLTISPADFRGQLEYLYANGYHPINFRDLLEDRIDVPAGKTPVVLTFDDSSDSQFTIVERDGRLAPDPDGAVGIIAGFHADHPDWPMRATFFVLPAARPPNNLFGQPELAEGKLRYLVDNGMEVANHTLWHADLAAVSGSQVQEQLGMATEAIERLVPDYDVVSLALPYGNYPADESLLRAGSHDGVPYALEGAAEIVGGPSYPPGDVRFDPFHVPRVQAEPGKGLVGDVFHHFEEHPEERYVSDGDPGTVAFPLGAGDHLDRAALTSAGLAVVEY
jgi:peptidoglycan/xylan/chitin deacetylase (PgdA/CDA1 family)